MITNETTPNFGATNVETMGTIFGEWISGGPSPPEWVYGGMIIEGVGLFKVAVSFNELDGGEEFSFGGEEEEGSWATLKCDIWR